MCPTMPGCSLTFDKDCESNSMEELLDGETVFLQQMVLEQWAIHGQKVNLEPRRTDRWHMKRYSTYVSMRRAKILTPTMPNVGQDVE